MTQIQIIGLDKLLANLKKFPKQIEKNLGQAGNESAENIIFPTQGLKGYPPATAGNQPPAPFYIRGRGLQTGTRNLGNSERAGTQFYSRNEGSKTLIGNRASYAHYLFGEETQAVALKQIGWKTLVAVINDKIGEIRDVYQKWVDKTITDLNL